MSPRAGIAPAAAALWTLAVGALWLVAEVAVARVTIPGVSGAGLLARLVEVAPWHMALFAGWGVAIAAAARLRPFGRSGAVWLAVGAGVFTFLGARVFEGRMRSAGPGAAVVATLAVALATAFATALVAALPRLTSGRLRTVATVALQAAVALGAIAFLERAGWDVGRVAIRSIDLAGVVSAAEAVRLAGVAVGAALALAAGSALARIAGVAVVAGALAAAPAPPAPPARPALAGAPDVVLLVLDTLRGDHVGARDAQGPLTPALDALAADGVAFPNAYAPSNWTRGSMPGLLASLPFEVTGNAPPGEVDLLAEHLQRAGWSTVGISANPLIAARLGWAQGFDRFEDPNSMGEFAISHILQVLGAALPAQAYRIGAVTNSSYFRAAAEMRRRAERLLDGAGRPTFLYVQPMDPHGPYLPPPAALPPGFEFENVDSYYRFMQLRGKEELGSEAYRARLENFRVRYAASVRHLDAELGRLLDDLRARGRYDETLIVVTADHGEAFGEHDWAGHTGLELGPALIGVPLLVKPPKSWGVAPRVEPAAVSGYSLVPTLLGLLDLPQPEVAFGADLSALVRGESAAAAPIVFADSYEGDEHIYAAIRWPWKLVELHGETRRVRGLYDLAADPAEERSLAEERPDLVAELAREIDGFRERVAAAKLAGQDADADARTLEQLRRLGYIQ